MDGKNNSLDLDLSEDKDNDRFTKFAQTDINNLCKDYAGVSRVNLADEHGKVVNTIATIEEQLHSFNQLLDTIRLDNTASITRMLPVLADQFEMLAPSLKRVDMMEELVTRVKTDLDVLERQMVEAESTVDSRGVGLASVFKIPLNILNKQLGGGTEISFGDGNPSYEFTPHNIVNTSKYFTSDQK